MLTPASLCCSWNRARPPYPSQNKHKEVRRGISQDFFFLTVGKRGWESLNGIPCISENCIFPQTFTEFSFFITFPISVYVSINFSCTLFLNPLGFFFFFSKYQSLKLPPPLSATIPRELGQIPLSEFQPRSSSIIVDEFFLSGKNQLNYKIVIIIPLFF